MSLLPAEPPTGEAVESARERNPPFWCRGARWVWAHAPTLLVFAATFGYIAAMLYTAWLKYLTFNDTFEDLGIGNQILWLLSHGGVSNYYSSGFAHIYPMQWQKPIIFVVLPFYAADPTALTLIAMQTIVLGLPAIPLYYLGRTLLKSRWLPAVVAVAYLAYFPVASANLFDFQFENFAPLFYLLMVLAWERGRYTWSCIAGAFCAAVNPLTLLLVGAFLLYTILRHAPSMRSPRRYVREIGHRLLDNVPRMLLLWALPVILLLYDLAGTLYTAGAGAGTPGAGPLAQFGFAINDKIMLLLFLFGAVAFIPLYEPWFLWLLSPYLLWVFYSQDPAHWATFGLMYPVLAAGPIFYATLLSFGRLSNQRAAEPSSHPEPPAPSGAPPPSSFPFQPRWHLSPRSERAIPFVVLTVAFAVVYLPWSPVNSYVQGGYFSGNHNYAGITTITSGDRFLWRVINLIPAGGSVLSQNGIPQISGREYAQIDTLYTTSIPYDYILADTNITLFSQIASIAPFLQSAISNRTFGVLAEGYGAILLERGYTGPARLFAPYAAELNSGSLSAYPGTSAVGTQLVRSASGFSMWFGPYLTLFPGNYSAEFRLQVNDTSRPSQPVVTIEVSANQGSSILASTSLTESNFTAAGTTGLFALHFSLGNLESGVELRGMSPGGGCTITLEGIEVSQGSYR
ncbi:MAG: DUF2079 domain-containing protein [Thermoplasmata archaeon]|nr:DUF2079 domain-containing protein [Thermoplasmata archaeon]